MHGINYLGNFNALVKPNYISFMKKLFLPVLIIIFALSLTTKTATAQNQTVELLGGNVLNGAVTGTLLGVSVMGLQNNSNDFAPLRIGLGAGIIGGAGIAAYDIITLPQDQQFFISGLFNDGNNSSIIVLLDTMYGAATGAVLGTALMLIQNKPIVDGIQYGGSAGAWAGFGVGLIDAFLLSERNHDFTASALLNRSSLIETSAGPLDLGFGEPAIYYTLSLEPNSNGYDFAPGFKFFSISSRF